MPKRKTNRLWSEIPVGKTFSIPELRSSYGFDKSLLVDTAIRNFLGRQIKIGCVEKLFETGKFGNEVFQMKYTKVKEDPGRKMQKKTIPAAIPFDKTINAADLGALFIDSFTKIKEELKKSKEELIDLKTKIEDLDKENAELKLCVQRAEKEKIECQQALDGFIAKYNNKSISLKDVVTVHS
jgi:hypothetical protein